MAKLDEKPIADLYAAFVRYATSHPDLRLSTVQGYRSTANVVKIAFGKSLAKSMKPSLVNSAQERLLAEGYKASTVKKKISQFRAAWNWARRNGLVSREWCKPDRVRSSKRKAELKSRKRPYTVVELWRVKRAVPEHWRPVIHLMVDVGCRAGEVCAANVEDICVDGEGTAWWSIPDSKTGEPREVPVLNDTRQAISSSLCGRRSGPLFRGRRNQRLTLSSLDHAIGKTLDRLGMRKVVSDSKIRVFDLDLNSLRRSWIRHGGSANVNRIVRMAITGHELVGVHDGYSRNGVDRGELVEAVKAVRAWRGDRINELARQASTIRYNPSVSKTVRTLPRTPLGLTGGEVTATGFGFSALLDSFFAGDQE